MDYTRSGRRWGWHEAGAPDARDRAMIAEGAAPAPSALAGGPPRSGGARVGSLPSALRVNRHGTGAGKWRDDQAPKRGSFLVRRAIVPKPWTVVGLFDWPARA
ncbi:hypothetical protein CLV40_110120 [Actinokineospora auranticolor]|uniref:Uncharacterized protein n=1 Tax=Actinokineospora auranticolor TaxID=155976 RepID=A0A2S6GMM7_9PSEU|nr:hypothetical protein CLV40_110120 [Actinokineospora auranticolor]